MLTTLFLDLNSYFASVEQQVRPELRGRAMAVAPVVSDSGCCIAVSYEGKAFSVKTGTRVGEARRLCPGIEIVDARPRLYVIMHHRVLKAIEKHMPIDKVHSIDEVSCRLDRTQRTAEACAALAVRIKAEIRRSCGVCMRCSIGCAPNRTLAKLGTDLKKPDGLVIFTDEDLPRAIEGISPQELSGIGPRMMERLRGQGIATIGDLLRRSPLEMRELWGGLVGERWYYILRGQEVPEVVTRKGSIGHQHVLAPKLRTAAGARGVSMRLLLKAAARLRHDGYAARKVSLGLRFPGDAPSMSSWGVGAPSWDKWVSLGQGCVDSTTMLEALEGLWKEAPATPPMMVSVTLSDLVAPGSLTLPLFEKQGKRESVSKAMDVINKRFGANKLYTAGMQEVRGHGTGGIAFNYVPDLDVADSVQSRQRDGEGQEGKKYLSDAEMEELIERSVGVV